SPWQMKQVLAGRLICKGFGLLWLAILTALPVVFFLPTIVSGDPPGRRVIASVPGQPDRCGLAGRDDHRIRATASLAATADPVACRNSQPAALRPYRRPRHPDRHLHQLTAAPLAAHEQAATATA